MSKRARDASDDFESIARKIKKLEQQLMRARHRKRERQISSSSSSSTSKSSRSSSSCSGSRSQSPNKTPCLSEPQNIEGVPTWLTEPVASTSAGATDQQPSTSAAAVVSLPSTSGIGTAVTRTNALPSTSNDPTTPQPNTSEAPDQEAIDSGGPASQLDDELLQILGEDPSQTKTYGKDIQQDLAVRLQHIATAGLTKEARKELLDRYLPPANCVLIDAPTLNPEAVYAIPDTVLKRDKGIELRKKQQASAASCVAEALTLLISSEPKNTALIKLLMDAAKLICDSQAIDSTVRRNFVLHGLKKDLKDQLQATKIDKFLFGENLAETLKAAKAISRSGADMKPTLMKQPATNKKPQQNLNWRAPPPSQRPKGTQRMKEPIAQKNRHANSSKQSSRPAPSRSRHRR